MASAGGAGAGAGAAVVGESGGGQAATSSAGSAGAPAVGGSQGTAGAGGLPGQTKVASASALAELKDWLALAPGARADLSIQAFAKVSLTRADTAAARGLLLADYTAQLKQARSGEVGATEQVAKTITASGVGMKYYLAKRGTKPSAGWNLFISMHGGGGTEPATNDEQWQNQIALVNGYNPQNAVWVAPRAPTDEWNMWFRDHIDALFERLIADMIAFEGVDANHVYLNGYSAGGDGAYQMGTRMADAWAGIGMSAGHPNDASPLNLRDTAFALHVGGDDAAFDRNKKAAEWGMLLDALAAKDPGGYSHQWQVHAGLPHWMNLADAVSIPFLQSNSRQPLPAKVIWRQASRLRSSFYWLRVSLSDVTAGAQISASRAGQTVTLSGAQAIRQVTVRVNDAMLNQDEPVSVELGGKALFSGPIARTIDVLYRTLAERGDPELMFSGEATVKLP